MMYGALDGQPLQPIRTEGCNSKNESRSDKEKIGERGGQSDLAAECTDSVSLGSLFRFVDLRHLFALGLIPNF